MGAYNFFQKVNRLQSFILIYRQYAIITVQIFFILFSYTLAFFLRFDFQIPPEQQAILIKTLPWLLACRLLTYYLFKLNSGWWRFVSMLDLVNITKANILGTILFLLGLVFGYGLSGYPRSVIIIEAVLNFVLMGGIRFGVRWCRETFDKSEPKQLKYVLVVGAGKAGTQLLREIRSTADLGIRVVGFIDDDPMKKKAYIQGVNVLGNCKDIPDLVRQLDIDEVIIAIPCAGYNKISSIVLTAKECGVKAKVLPSLFELIHKDGLWRHLRDVPYDELLGRPILKFRRENDLELLRNEIDGKTVLITGAGGSIGSELSRQTAELEPQALILYERNETYLYFLELELRKQFPECNVIPVLGDILNREKFNRTITRHKVNLIYHAAAYKHVPMMQREPFEAVHNNILATKIVADAAVVTQVQKCVYISSDKAVNPSNVMGATKRVGEMIMQAFSNHETRFITVRFGNVIGSNGSVIPLFKKQIAKGGPVTVTHPEVTRYFMAISEAVQLVMTAGAMGKGGEIFLLDMGEPIRIMDLANKLIKSSGLTPRKDIEITYIGLRPGEKLHEELYWKGENVISTNNRKITMLRTNRVDKGFLFSQIDLLEEFEKEKYSDESFKILKNLVPEGTFDNNERNVNEYLKLVYNKKH